MTTTQDPRSIARPTNEGHAKRRTHLRGWLLGREFYRAAEALDMAEQVHQGVRKDGTTPEVAHQVYIVSYLTTLHPHLMHPEATLIAGFLHDTVEDYDVTVADIESMFGEQVAVAVRALTKVRDSVKVDPTMVAYEQAMNPIASIVKAADRIHNQQTLGGVFTPTKIEGYIDETRTFILPMMKQARSRFPQQELAYQNARTVLYAQIEMLEMAMAGLLTPEG